MIKKEKNQSTENFKYIENYIISLKEVLGKGSFGIVYHGLDMTNKGDVAIKQIPLAFLKSNTDVMLMALKNEISNMRKVNHLNIVKLFDVKKSPNNLYLIVEFCNSGNLDEYLKKNNGRLSEFESLKIMKEIIEGYQKLYEMNIVHRDIKPANILIHDGVCKIGDLGFSKVSF